MSPSIRRAESGNRYGRAGLAASMQPLRRNGRAYLGRALGQIGSGWTLRAVIAVGWLLLGALLLVSD